MLFVETAKHDHEHEYTDALLHAATFDVRCMLVGCMFVDLNLHVYTTHDKKIIKKMHLLLNYLCSCCKKNKCDARCASTCTRYCMHYA